MPGDKMERTLGMGMQHVNDISQSDVSSKKIQNTIVRLPSTMMMMLMVIHIFLFVLLVKLRKKKNCILIMIKIILFRFKMRVAKGVKTIDRNLMLNMIIN